jgi:surface antigen
MIASHAANALECVSFAREVSGIYLRGDAWRWWDEASDRFDRGQAPRPGAVVVFKKFGSMRHGHVAVVTKIIDSRHVLIEHANWAPSRSHGRGKVDLAVKVSDVSRHNDWTEVRVWNVATGDFGTRTYPVYGFIYAPHGPAKHHATPMPVAANDTADRPPPVASMAGYADAIDPRLQAKAANGI